MDICLKMAGNEWKSLRFDSKDCSDEFQLVHSCL